MIDNADLWSDEINAFVDRAFETVTRNPSFYGEVAAYRYAIKLAIDESSQSQTDALKKAREDAIEECASKVEDYPSPLDDLPMAMAMRNVAAAIRRLKEQSK